MTRLLCSLLTLLALSRVAQADTFELLPTPAGFTDSYAISVSKDGKTITGHCDVAGPASDVYRWTELGGTALLGLGTAASVGEISHDGKTIVGFRKDDGRLFRWTTTAGISYYSYLNGSRRVCSAQCSSNGKKIVGDATVVGTPVVENFVWDSNTGFTTLSSASVAGGDMSVSDISGDGNSILGSGALGIAPPVIWDTTLSLTALPRAGVVTGANCTNLDGSVIGGFSEFGLVRWQRGFFGTTKEALPLAPGMSAANPFNLSDDGAIMVGYSIPGGIPECNTAAFLWTRRLGAISLKSYLESRGIKPSTQNLYLTRAVDVSGDGTTIIGDAYNTVTHTTHTFRLVLDPAAVL